MMKKQLLKKHASFKTRVCKNQTLLMIKMTEIDTLFVTKTAEKNTL